MHRLQQKYQKEVVPQVRKKFNLDNDLAVPKFMKITINSGTGKWRGDEKALEDITKDLAAICGQRAATTAAKKAIASFKTRLGQAIGLKVTLRGTRMFDFIDRLIALALPRSRDFHGFPLSVVDKKGNMNLGIPEQIIFPEISHENVRTIFGLQVCVTLNASDRDQALEVYKLMGFPLKK